MILLLDHDDSFVHTLGRYVAELGEAPEVVRVDTITLPDIRRIAPSHIILSPGPGTPRDCPLALEVIHRLGPATPILGVCLGHQCIAAAYGAVVERAIHPRHGMSSSIHHDGRGMFKGVPSPMLGTRYHSLAVNAATLPAMLEISATAEDGEVMGVRHRVHPVEGVQFHPESVLSEWGHLLLANFLGVEGNARAQSPNEIPR